MFVLQHRGRSLLALSLLLAVVSRGQVARDLKAKPLWNVAEATQRLIVNKEQDDFFLAKLPLRVGDKPVAAVRVFIADSEVPARVVWVDASDLTLLVNATAAKRGQMVKIYPVPGEQAMTAVDGAGFDPTPLRGFARRTAGMDFPSSLEEARMLEARFDRRPNWFFVGGTAGLPETFGDWFQGDWTRKNHLVDLQTWIVVPQTGSYRFGLAGVAPAWLLVDGREVLTHPPYQPSDKWTTDEKGIELSAGLRRIIVRTVVRQKIDTGLAWKREGEPGAATNMVMLTGGELRVGRWEDTARSVHPFASASSGAAYRFSGVDETFVPFTLVDGSAAWGEKHVARWRQSAREAPFAEGDKVEYVARRSGLPGAVEVVAVAEGGTEASFEVPLSYAGPVWAEYEMTSRMTDLDGVVYNDQQLHPSIRVRTNAPDGLGYELECRVVDLVGKERVERVALVPQQGWARWGVPSFNAGNTARVEWQVRHQGVAIERGVTRFMREPFEVLPDGVSGELLKLGSEFVVLVVGRASRGDPVPNSGDATKGVALFDGFIYTGSGEAHAEVEAEGWQVVDLQALERTDDSSGRSLLLPLVELGRGAQVGRVLLAPSLLGISSEGGLSGFERRLSALTALLASSAFGSPRLFLVIPPTFEVLPDCGCAVGEVPCEHAAAAREIAECVVRVADVHGVETIDLFSAFQTLGAGVGERLVVGDGLTAAGRDICTTQWSR